MKAIVFTEDADTVDDDEQFLLQYYKGQFRPVASFVQELSNFASTDIYILSEDYGVCQGSQTVSELTRSDDQDQVHQHAQSLLLEKVEDADVIILLLTKSAFLDVVEPIWNDLIETTKGDSIWGLGIPQSVLDAIELETLKAREELYIYPRVGVARIDTETRENILNAVEMRTA